MNPEAVAGLYAYQIVSGFDIYKPEKLNDLFERRGDQGMSYFMLLKSLGFEKPVAADEYEHYEDNWIHENFQVLANVSAPGAGNDLTITLDPNSLDANNRYYVRVNDSILMPNETVGYVVSINTTTPSAPVLVIRPYDATDDLGAVTADDYLVIFSNAWPERSGQPDGRVRGVYKYTNVAQIIKETIGVSGSELTRQTWIPVGPQGQSIRSYFNLAEQLDIDYRMAWNISHALLVGKKTTNTGAVDANGNVYKTTEGLIPYIRRVGNTYPVAAGAFAVTDFDAIDKLLTKEFAGNHILTMPGIDRHQEIENILVTYFTDTNIIYAEKRANDVLFHKNESLGASVNFKYLTKSERTYMFKRMESFNHQKGLGTTGYNYEDMALFLPLNKKKDPKSNRLVESIGCRYRQLGPYSRKMEVWQDGAAGNGLKIGAIDERLTYQRAHVGGHNRGGNQMVLVAVP
jgi:hypothetical protein